MNQRSFVGTQLNSFKYGYLTLIILFYNSIILGVLATKE